MEREEKCGECEEGKQEFVAHDAFDEMPVLMKCAVLCLISSNGNGDLQLNSLSWETRNRVFIDGTPTPPSPTLPAGGVGSTRSAIKLVLFKVAFQWSEFSREASVFSNVHKRADAGGTIVILGIAK